MSGGGGTTTSNTSTQVPPEVLQEYQKVVAQANQVAATPLQQYQGQIVASQNPTETAAYNTINNMQGITAPYTGAASNLVTSATQNINPNTVTAANIQAYESPYTQNVLNATMAAEANQDAQQQAQLQGNAISSGAWGGDRSAVAQGILAGQQAIANNATNAGILNQGYAQAVQEANIQQQAGIGAQEASQQLQLSGGLAQNQLGTSALANGLTAANAQLTAGQLQQQQAQAELNVPYEQFLQQQAYPFQTTGWLGNIAEGIGSNEGGTSTSSTTQPSQGLFGLKRGGIVPQHYDSGGGDDTDYYERDLPSAPRGITANDAVQAMTGYNLLPDGTPDNMPRDYGNLPSGIVPANPSQSGGINPPTPTPPVNAPDHPSNSPYLSEMPEMHEANPWLAVAAGVLGTLAGRSRNPLIDIGQGGLIGLNNYAEQQKIAEQQNYQEGSFHQNAQKLMDEAENTRNQFAEEKLRDSNHAEYQKGELANQIARNRIMQQQANQGKVAVNPITGQTYYTTGENAGKIIAGQENPSIQNFADNMGISLRPYQGHEDAKKSADAIDSSGSNIGASNDAILSLQRVQSLLPQIDQGKMAEYSRQIQKLMGQGSTAEDAIGKIIPSGTTERAAYEEISKLEGNAALQNEVANGIKGRALGFNMVKLGQNLFASPEMAKDAQESIVNKALTLAQLSKNANELIQPFEGHSTGTLNQIKQKYYNDSLAVGYAIPTQDYLSGAWKQPEYKPSIVTNNIQKNVPSVNQNISQPGNYSHLWGGH